MNVSQENNVPVAEAGRADADIRAIVDISPYPVFIHYNGQVKYSNKLTQQLIKAKTPAFNNWNVADYIHPEDLVQVRKTMVNYVNSKAGNVLNVRLIDLEGNTVSIQGQSIAVQYEGQLCRFVHIYNFDRAEQAMEVAKEKEELLSKLVEIIPDSLMMTDAVTRKTLYSNQSIIHSLGYTAADLEGKEEYQLIESKIHPEDQPKIAVVRDVMSRAENAGKFATAEYRVMDKAGKWRWILSRSCSIMPSKDGVGRINFGIVQDITEAKEKEQDLITYQLFQEKVNNTSPVLISIFDIATMTSVYQSKDMAEWFKYAPEDFPKRSFEVIHPEYRGQAIESIRSASSYADGQLQTTVFPAVQGDGTIKFLLTRSAVFQRDDKGQVTQILMVHSDVTDLKEVESKLDRSEETRKAILHAIPDMVVIMDRQGTISDFYPNEILRVALENVDFTGRNITELVTAENSTMLKDAIDLAMWQNKLLTVNFEHKGASTTYYLELRISPFSDDKVIVVGRDVSEHRESQDKIDRYNKELYEKNQELERYITSNSELEKFAYIASHDLREPLRSLTGFAQLLQKRNEGKLTRESEEFIENIISGAQRMNTLVSGLLEYSRITSAGKPFAVVHVPDLIRKVRSDLKISIEENHAELILFDLPDLYCDELQMRQLFQNLISNAIKFRSERAPIIKVSAEQSDKHWLFQIEDNGIGIDSRYKEQVFQIFTRLHSQDKYQGSGIGLSVCKKIIERHGGRIWLESTPGYGTTLFFTVAI